MITRPESSGCVLAQRLKEQNISSLCQPLFDYQTSASASATQQLVENNTQAIVIFVSVAAVEFANQAYALKYWSNKHIIAVGEKTQQALAERKIIAQIPQQQCSEGLLELNVLREVNHKDIIIVRGDGGREHLAQQLTMRGATVHYLESYIKVWRSFTTEIAQQWQNNEINCIVVTSNAILERVLVLINNSTSYWKKSCLWIVASDRIKDHANNLGLSRVINANGANDDAIITAIRQYGISHDR